MGWICEESGVRRQETRDRRSYWPVIASIITISTDGIILAREKPIRTALSTVSGPKGGSPFLYLWYKIDLI